MFKYARQKWVEIISALIISTLSGLCFFFIKTWYKDVNIRLDKVEACIGPHEGGGTLYGRLEEIESSIDDHGTIIYTVDDILDATEKEFRTALTEAAINVWAIQNNMDRDPEPRIYINVQSPSIGFMNRVAIGQKVRISVPPGSGVEPIPYPVTVAGLWATPATAGGRTKDVQLNRAAQELVGLTDREGLKLINVRPLYDEDQFHPAIYFYSRWKRMTVE